MIEEQAVDAVYGVLFIGEDVVGVGNGAAGDEVVGCGGEFLFRWSSYSDVQFGVELARVAGYYLGMQLLGQLYGSGCFA